MTLPTFDSARDEVFGMFNTKWAADTPAINGGSAIPVEWQGVDSNIEPSIDQPYARITIRHTISRASAFGHNGTRRHTRPALVTVQVFSPFRPGFGLSFAENAAIIARDAFEGFSTATGIWFRNARIQEIGPTAGWFQMNVIVEFEYDEVK